MRILFTGASSFTGYWFVKALVMAGHAVTTIFRKPPGTYTDTRAERVNQVVAMSEALEVCSFGDDRFLELIRGGSWDLLCHHAADVTNYKSNDFDSVAALANNTRNLEAVLDALCREGCQNVLLTGSVFEQREGTAPDMAVAFSPYGLSKGLTYDMFQYYTQRRGMHLAKFVIPNPFGPYEEQRFTSFLVKSWLRGEHPRCDSPNYVRDNIHVSLLAKAYCRFAEETVAKIAPNKLGPCGYPESQGAFTQRFAREMEKRLGVPCPVDLVEDHLFPEPRVRINTDVIDKTELEWNESAAWDELATYYHAAYKTKPSN
ncbi:hypothetical protein SCG7086_BK_00080 [Chlamydiales bacterium SCGC AG-110-P3]|nr:hypothetical protein SCG7086_BK_00080 [Chlamydiales bacterium SCGC AG-110-P3]